MIPLQGFAPDADATTPGVLTDCTQFVPYLTGMEGAPGPITPTDTPVLAASCIGAAVAQKLDGTRRIFAGTAAKLYELAGGAWNDVSRVGNYSGGADTRWSFAQYGNSTLAANRVEGIQRSTGAAFADVAGAPKAEVLFSIGAFVMALNVNDGDEKPDGWHCCAAYDDTSWTPSITTQATRGRLVDSPGPLTAGMRLGEYAVAYKNRSIYLGQYVGAPVVWDWTPVPGGDAGCIGKEAICDIGGMHFFVGEENFWLFDGTRPVPIGDGQVRQWFFDNSDPLTRYRTKCVFEKQTNRVWIFYPKIGSTECDGVLVYHVLAKKWGKADRQVEAVVNYIVPQQTIDGLPSIASTMESMPIVSYDSQYWTAGGKSIGVFNTSHQLQILAGPSVNSTFTTGEYGDDDQVSLLRNIRLRFASGFGPTSASASTYYKANSGDSYAAGSGGTMADGKFDVLRAARWHQATFSFSGQVRVTGMKADFVPAGMR